MPRIDAPAVVSVDGGATGAAAAADGAPSTAAVMLNCTPLADARARTGELRPEPVLVSVTFERSGTSARRESSRATLSYENAVPWMTKPCAGRARRATAAAVPPLGAVIVS